MRGTCTNYANYAIFMQNMHRAQNVQNIQKRCKLGINFAGIFEIIYCSLCQSHLGFIEVSRIDCKSHHFN